MSNRDIKTTMDISVDMNICAAFWEILNAGRRDGLEEQRRRVDQTLEQLMRRYIHEHLKDIENQQREAAAGPRRSPIAEAFAKVLAETTEITKQELKRRGYYQWPLDPDAKPQSLRQAVAQAKARGRRRGLQDAREVKAAWAEYKAWRQSKAQQKDGAA